VLLLLDRALVVGLRPAALVVLAVDVVLDAVGLLEPLGSAEEQPGGAPRDEQDLPAAVLADRDERLDVRRAVERHALLARLAPAHDLEQPDGLAGEHGEAPDALPAHPQPAPPL